MFKILSVSAIAVFLTVCPVWADNIDDVSDNVESIDNVIPDAPMRVRTAEPVEEHFSPDSYPDADINAGLDDSEE
jgi:hypothetical protein